MTGLTDPSGLSFARRMDIQREAADVLGRTGLTPCELEAAWLDSRGKLRAMDISLATLSASMDLLNGAIDGLCDLASRNAAPIPIPTQVRP